MTITNDTTCLLLSLRENMYGEIKIAVVPAILKEKDSTFISRYSRTMYQYIAYYNYRNFLYNTCSDVGRITELWFDDLETDREEKVKYFYNKMDRTHYFLSRDKQAIKGIAHNKLFQWKHKKLFQDPEFDFSQINFTYKQIICDLKHAKI